MKTKPVYEYKVVEFDAGFAADMQRDLNTFGAIGYELVAVTKSSHALDRPVITAFFKRAKESPDD